jgi:hypothetical protein
MTPDNLMIALSNAQPGREDEYRDWYKSQHVGEVVADVSAIESGSFLSAVPDQAGVRCGFAALYTVTGDAVSGLDEVLKLAGGGQWKLSSAIDRASLLMIGATAIGPRVESGRPANGPIVSYLVLTNPVDGQEDSFNSWYQEQHLPDLMNLQGFVGARRYKLATSAKLPPLPWRYLAVYEADGSQLDTAIAEMGKAAGTDRMPISPALKQDDVHAVFYQPG